MSEDSDREKYDANDVEGEVSRIWTTDIMTKLWTLNEMKLFYVFILSDSKRIFLILKKTWCVMVYYYSRPKTAASRLASTCRTAYSSAANCKTRYNNQ
jgi:hypothetical protein